MEIPFCSITGFSVQFGSNQMRKHFEIFFEMSLIQYGFSYPKYVNYTA